MNESAPSERPQPTPKQGAGALLLAERRRQGLSLGDVSRQLKLSVRQVEALEGDDYAMFRSPVFVHGFIRNYAKLLGVDAEPLIVAADSLLNPEAVRVQADAASAEAQSGDNRLGLGKIAGGVAAVLVVAAIVYLVGRGDDGELKEPAAFVAQPQAPTPDSVAQVAEVAQATGAGLPEETAPASAPVPAADATTVRMVFDQESWVEIRDGEGNAIFGQLVPAGSRRSVSGVPPLAIVIGNAGGVRLSYKAKDIDLTPYTRVNVARLTLE